MCRALQIEGSINNLENEENVFSGSKTEGVQWNRGSRKKGWKAWKTKLAVALMKFLIVARDHRKT